MAHDNIDDSANNSSLLPTVLTSLLIIVALRLLNLFYTMYTTFGNEGVQTQNIIIIITSAVGFQDYVYNLDTMQATIANTKSWNLKK